MLTVNGFCCTIYDPRDWQGREIPQRGKYVSASRFANAWCALEDFKDLDPKNIPKDCFFGISFCRAGKPGSHPTDSDFQPLPFDAKTKNANMFIFMDGKLIKGPINVDAIDPREKLFPKHANRDTKAYVDYDSMRKEYGLDKARVDVLYFNCEENFRRKVEGLPAMKIDSVRFCDEIQDDLFLVEIVVMPHNATMIPTPKASLTSIEAFPHLAHFRFAFAKTNAKLVTYGISQYPAFVHNANISINWGSSISGRPRP